MQKPCEQGSAHIMCFGMHCAYLHQVRLMNPGHPHAVVHKPRNLSVCCYAKLSSTAYTYCMPVWESASLIAGLLVVCRTTSSI